MLAPVPPARAEAGVPLSHPSYAMAIPRESRTLTARFERWALPRMARRLPAWVTPDMLTALALAAALVIGIAYGLAGRDLAWLHVASLAFVVHWFGDSLDGTLARERDIRRERYGFFVDHSADAVSAWLILGGLAVSGLARPWLALIALGGYLAHMLHAAQVAIARDRYVLAPAGGIGPTEVRIVVILVHTVLWATGNPEGWAGWRLMDVLLGVVAGALVAVWLAVLARERSRLSKEDPTPGPRPRP